MLAMATSRLHRILSGNVLHYLMKGNTSTASMPLSPHEFIQIGWQLVCMASSHTLQLSLHSIPIWFNMLGMDAGGWINKMKGMIYHFMIESWNRLDSTVAMLPTHQTRMDGCMWCSVGSYDGQESGSITSGYDLHCTLKQGIELCPPSQNPTLP